MERNRSRRRILAATLLVVALGCAPTASAAPTSPLCEDGSYRKAHPLICDTGEPGPFNLGGGGGAAGGGGSGGGGLIGRVLGALGL